METLAQNFGELTHGKEHHISCGVKQKRSLLLALEASSVPLGRERCLQAAAQAQPKLFVSHIITDLRNLSGICRVPFGSVVFYLKPALSEANLFLTMRNTAFCLNKVHCLTWNDLFGELAA